MPPRYALHVPPRQLYTEQRHRLATKLQKGQCAVVAGANEVPLHDTDVTYHEFRQEAYFNYLFGYNMPGQGEGAKGVFGCVIGTGDPTNPGKSVLFVPKLDPSYAVWLGALPTLESIKEQIQVDEVQYSDDIVPTLKRLGVEEVMVMVGVNTDSGLSAKPARFDGIDQFKIEQSSPNSALFNLLSTQRVYKTELEFELLRKVCEISSKAHVHVMQMARPGMSQNQLESLFLHYCYFHGGCRFVSYTCICATGESNSILHYPNNDKYIEDGEMALLDMGANLNGMAADITCSFPINSSGKFTAKQKAIYECVLDAQTAVFKAMKPSVSWVEMHKLALRTMSRHLIRLGVITCDEETAEKAEVMYTFQPHGLGHLIGYDVHDVGGYSENAPPRPTQQLCCRLRTARNLEAGQYITVEPGCYFNHALLEKAFADPKLKPLLNEELIRKEYWNFGGVRIEDDVAVTEKGIKNFTLCPRGVHEIEAVLAGCSFEGRVKEWVNVE